MRLLGLRLCEHDSNFSYFDGEKVHYHKSERSYQIKHHAFNNLTEWKDEIKRLFDIDYKDLDEIAIVVDPWRHNLPIDNEHFFPSVNYNEYVDTKCPIQRINHHYAHALSTWMMQETPADVSIIIDGFGDKDISWSVFKNDKLIEEGSHEHHGSIGTEMCAAGEWLGVEAQWGIDIAGKVMGLQAYGNFDKEYYNILKQYTINDVLQIFNLDNWYRYKNSELLGKLSPLDWINTVHYSIGEMLVDFFSKHANPNDTIVYSGGVAQNVIWNTKLRENFPNIIIPPHCADDGLSLGALEFLRQKHNLDKFKLDNFPYAQSDTAPNSLPTQETIKTVAEILSQGKTVGWYQGHGEIGPRALGNRSILVNPQIPNAKDIINKIKNRETYRPFGASILEEYAHEYFEDLKDDPYMLYVGKFKHEKQLKSITHVDKTCRVQTVKKDSGSFRLLLEEFYKLTGCPILLNTSLNIAGKPIAGYPSDAYELFRSSTLDCFVIGNDYAVK
jgi:carbamoyltransferase